MTSPDLIDIRHYFPVLLVDVVVISQKPDLFWCETCINLGLNLSKHILLVHFVQVRFFSCSMVSTNNKILPSPVDIGVGVLECLVLTILGIYVQKKGSIECGRLLEQQRLDVLNSGDCCPRRLDEADTRNNKSNWWLAHNP